MSADVITVLPSMNPGVDAGRIDRTIGGAGPVGAAFSRDWLFTVWIAHNGADVPVAYWLACVNG